jgi:hypothetical protein
MALLPDEGKAYTRTEEEPVVLSQRSRDEILAMDVPLAKYRLRCLRQVWRFLPLGNELRPKAIAVLTKDRAETCFFFPFAAQMTAEAAIQLEAREREKRGGAPGRTPPIWSCGLARRRLLWATSTVI